MHRIAYLAIAVAAAAATTPTAAVRDLLSRYLRQGVSADSVQGVRALAPFMTKRLRQVLDDARACNSDWARQQPKGSDNKPPFFADCCLFASSPEGLPTSFRIVGTETLADGRVEVSVEYTFQEGPRTYDDPSIPLSSWRWRDAFIVTREGGGYLVDDFVYRRDTPQSPALLLSASFEGCQGRRWTGGR